MAITVEEKPGSRTLNLGESPSTELLYLVRGTDSEKAAVQALLNSPLVPAVYTVTVLGQQVSLSPKAVTVEPEKIIAGQGDQCIWNGEVRYARASALRLPRNTVAITSVDTRGGTQHFTQSLCTIGRYAPPGKTAPDYQGAIGVTHDSVEGVDLTVPVFAFTVRKVFAQGGMPSPGTLHIMTGTCNHAAWSVTDTRDGLTLSFLAGECAFLGASIGDPNEEGDREVEYSLAGSPNAVDLIVGDITVPFKAGWDYLWVRYEDDKDDDAKAVVKRPAAAYVERVYPPDNFAFLGL